MSRQLYEEALTDVKRLKEVAEDNAKRAIMDVVTPRIRELIERQLLGEDALDGESLEDLTPEEPGAVVPGVMQQPTGVMVAEPVTADLTTAAAISLPDAEGKVTLDIDALCPEPAGAPVAPPQFGAPLSTGEEEFEVSMESVNALTAVRKKTYTARIDGLVKVVKALKETYRAAPSAELSRQITEMIRRVEDTYDNVQGSKIDQALRERHEVRLEECFKALTQIQEMMMSKQSKKVNKLDEADVTLKLTGLPDDVDLDSVGVDLITGEEEDGEAASEVGGAEAVPDDGEGLDLGGDEGSSHGEDMDEALNLSDDTIVEIDENMLRREIARMRKLREESGHGQDPASWGDGVGAKEMDDFGGAKEEGDPLDLQADDVAKISKPLGESDEADLDEADQDQMDEDDQADLDEADQDQMDEDDQADLDEADQDQMDQLHNRRQSDEFGPEVADGHASPMWDKRKHESMKRRLSFEKRLQERAKVRAASLKKLAGTARTARDAKKLSEIKRSYAAVAKRFNESVERSKKFSKLIKLHESKNLNGSAERRVVGAVDALQKKLAETNLYNAKLVYTNKLLQNEQLTTKQKAQVIKRLSEAKSIREAKLAYDGLIGAIIGTSTRALSEARGASVQGSGSRVTQPAAKPVLSEGVETDRWARLAGIVKG